jgi:hypothetical protein
MIPCVLLKFSLQLRLIGKLLTKSTGLTQCLYIWNRIGVGTGDFGIVF